MTAKTKRKTPAKKNAAKTPAQRLRVVGYVFVGVAILSAGAFAALFVDFKALPTQIAETATRAVKAVGFRVDEVDIRGAQRFTYDQIADIAQVDLAATVFGQDISMMQTRLEAQTWIESAHVMRKLPNVISIDVNEYQPFARWQLNGQLRLVDENGDPFLAIGRNEWRQLPLIVGPGAPDAAGPLASALAQYPTLSHRLASATRIGNRRWDLSFHSGALVRLPEDNIAKKLAQLSRMQAENKLLDGKAIRIDMRMDQMLAISTSPGKEYVPPKVNQMVETAG